MGGGLEEGVKRCGNNKSFRFIVEQSETSHGMFTPFKKLIAFSLVELMISLITISCIAAAFTPVITKKLKKQDVALSLAQTSEISDNCGKESGKNFGNNTDGYNCKLCTKAYCIQCGLTDCGEGNYIDQKTCTCKNCKTDAGLDNCTSCKIENSTAVCTACEIGNGMAGTGYYLKREGSSEISKTCKKCDSGYFCEDGIVEKKQSTCQNPPSGYVCKNNKLVACAQLFSSNCSRCTLQKCTSCGYGTHADSKGNCIGCGIERCSNCGSCDGYDTCKKCNGCDGGMLVNNDTACKSCSEITANCSKCDSRTGVCTACWTGYYLTNNKQCQYCGIENCTYCLGGQSASNKKCAMCRAGYYANGSLCSLCSSKYGSSCVACNSSQCLACEADYSLESNPALNPACKSTKGTWKCSDNNFIRIGNLCVTRYGMGDNSLFKIPSSVHVVEAGGEYCYAAAGELCCWSKVGACNGNGVYKGCRTRCTQAAAVEICNNFKYAGLKWRLPTPDEARLWYEQGYGGDNALRLCDNGGVNTPCQRPQGDSGCKGVTSSIVGDCFVSYYVTQNTSGGCGSVYLNPYIGNLLDVGYGGVDQTFKCSATSSPGEVRCVAEMKDDE